MAQRPPAPSRRPYDLAALVAVLATAVALVALGVSPESLAAVTVALSGLYSTWRLGTADRESTPLISTPGSRAQDMEAGGEEPPETTEASS